SALREATEGGWKEKLQQDTMVHLRHKQDVDWDKVPGFISLVNLVYTVTEFFEFAARISQAGIYQGSVEISIDLNKIQGYVLTTDGNKFCRQYCVANEDHLSKTWNISSESLIAGSQDHSLNAIVWLCECLGWMSPNIDAIRGDQQKLLQGRY